MPQTTTALAEDARIAAELAAGLTHHKAGRLAEAGAHYRRVLEVRAEHAEANNLLGLVHLASGDSQGAAGLLEMAVAVAPDNPQYLCNAAVALDSVLQHERAVQLLGRAIALKPDYAEAHSNLGMVFKRMHRPAEAAVHYRQAIELRPDEAGFHYNLGNTLVDLGELLEAEGSYRRALELRPRYPLAIAALATLLEELGRPAEAAVMAERSLEIPPIKRDATFHRSRGHAYRLAGKLEMAEESFRRALAKNPADADAWEGLSRTRRYDVRDADLDALVRLRQQEELDLSDRIRLDLVLGRWFDDIGDYATSYDFFASANAGLRGGIEYSAEREERDTELIRALFDPIPGPLPAIQRGENGPIFVVGEPRSGKTTLEGMLARHPRIKAAGELQFMPALGRDLSKANGLASDGAHISRVPAGALDALGKSYLASVKTVVPEGFVSIDTMPPNYRLVGLIRLALPNARVILTRRDPIDHSIDLFQKRFPKGSYGYTYDLAELGAHLRMFNGLMAWWNTAFPGFIYDVEVAELTEEPKMRSLLDFCGLAWASSCLDFHESEPRLGDAPAVVEIQRRQRRAFYGPLLRPYLAGT